MNIEPDFLLICGIVFLAFTTQAATGFGAMVIAMTLGALIFPVDTLLGWFVPQVVLLSCYLLIRHHGHIAWGLFLRIILPCMAVGMVVGQTVFYSLDTGGLKIALGVVVMLLALRELLRRKDFVSKPPMLPWTIGAGVVHGVFATGGPLLVYALNGQKLEKGVFRSTLALVWLVMALVLLSSLMISGKLTTQALPNIGLLAAILPFTIIAGEWLHSKIDAGLFQRAINVLLVISGAVLALG